jgi:penicillin-binding protein 1C
VVAVGVLALGLTAGAWIRLGPLPDGLVAIGPAQSIVIVDRFGEPIHEVRGADGQRGEWIAADAVPRVLADATIAAEDRRFRRHVGMDPVAVVRATWQNVRARRIVEGGSTITQQVAELLLRRQHAGTRQAGWRQQLWEAVLALRLEHRFSKDEILALYLNLAPYGNQIEGVQRAARAYFGRALQADDPITPAQAAYLAALPQQPTRFNPWRRPEAPRARQQRILKTMAHAGWLSAEAYATATDEHVTLQHEARSAVAPHFVERVLADVAGQTPRRVETTLDRHLQGTVQSIIAAHRDELDAHRASNVAVVVLDNQRGEWLAWEGSGNYFDTRHGGAIDGVVTPRQPGSALKPFTYAAAFERGAHPGTVLADVPSQFPTAEEGILYAPENYDGRFRGPLLARVALAGSENVPAVALADRIGVPAVARLLRQAGISTLDQNAGHYGLGLTLGNAEVRLDELVVAYGALARGGMRLTPRRVTRIDGRAIEAAAPERLLTERTAFWVTDILADNDARAFVFGRGGSLEFPFPVAAKTGTSQAYHDNWAIGYTRDVTVGVWVGNFDRTPLGGSSGVTGAGPIFHDVMLAAVERVRGALPIDDPSPVATPVTDVKRATLCAVSGMAATDHCVRRVTEWVPTAPALASCTWHHLSEQGLVTIWPHEYEAWARREGIWRDAVDRSAVASSPSRSAASERMLVRADARSAPTVLPGSSGTLTIVAPLSGATYLIDPTLRTEFQTLPLRASGATAGASLQWRVNGVAVGTVEAGEALRWPLARGRHVIEVRESERRAATTWIEVR